MARFLGYGIAALVGLIVVAGAIVYLSLDFFVARAIESEGSAALGTPVQVDAVDLTLTESRGAVRGVEVANPEGFSDAPAFVLGEVALAIDAESMAEETIRLNEIRIGDSRVRVELGERGFSNLEKLLEVVRSPAEPTPQESAGEPARFRVDELRFAGGEIVLAREGKKDQILDLPEIRLRDLGGSEGATGAEIGRLATEALLQRVALTAAGHELGDVLEREIGGAAGEAAGDILRGIFD
ncbi:MAG: hypothetical protein AAF430_08315 [Myxococcota bacterium]